MHFPLKVGLQLPEAERPVYWPELRSMAINAEEAGFDSLWVGDHLLYRAPDRPPRAPWEAWTTLAALAAVTDRVELGPLVASTSFHAPAMLAKKAAAVDDISNGRLLLGLGAGWNEPEYAAFGFPYDHRVGRFEEAFAIIRRLLAGEEVTFAGRWYEIDRAILLPEARRTSPIPLLIGSIGDRMLRTALPWVQVWNSWYDDFGNDPVRFAALNRRITEQCAALGRNPDTLSRSAAVFVQVAGGTGRATLYASAEQATPIAGTPEDIAAGLQRFVDAGADHLQIVLDPITNEGIAAFAPVIPLLKRV